jgi:hypothetical protein
MSELLLCPFCGSGSASHEFHSKRSCEKEIEPLSPCPHCGSESASYRSDALQVRCGECSASVSGANECEAVRAWNRRFPKDKGSTEEYELIVRNGRIGLRKCRN